MEGVHSGLESCPGIAPKWTAAAAAASSGHRQSSSRTRQQLQGERDGDFEDQERKGRAQVSNVILIIEVSLIPQFILYHYEYL